MTYIYYEDQKGEWRWRLVAANGRIIAGSGEGYKNEQDCLDDIDRVKDSRNAKVQQELFLSGQYHVHGGPHGESGPHGLEGDPFENEPLSGTHGSGDEP